MKKCRFTWIDALVILVVGTLLIGTFVKFFVKDNTALNKPTEEFTYQLKISGIRQCSVDSLQVGDTLYNSEGKGEVGVISEITVVPATTNYTHSDGAIKKATVEDKFDVTLTITAAGTPSSSGYALGTYDIRINHSSSYFTKYSTWNGTVISIN